MSVYIVQNGELYHYGIKGMKWGVRRSEQKHKPVSEFGTARRVTRATAKNIRATTKLSTDMTKAALSDYPAAIKYGQKGFILQTKYRKRFKQVVNSYLDSINDDISKVNVEKDFFTKHKNDRVEDILNNGNNAMVMYMLMVANSHNM